MTYNGRGGVKFAYWVHLVKNNTELLAGLNVVVEEFNKTFRSNHFTLVTYSSVWLVCSAIANFGLRDRD